MRGITASHLAIAPVVAAAGVILLASGTAGAQEPASPAAFREECRRAEQVLSLDRPGVARDRALSFITSCPGGAVHLAAAWSSPPTQPQALARLAYASRAVTDERIATRLRDVAADPARPRLTRIAALSVLAAYVDPSASLPLDEAVLSGRPRDPVLGLLLDAPRRSGEVAVNVGGILRWFESRASAEPDAGIRSLIQRVSNQLRP